MYSEDDLTIPNVEVKRLQQVKGWQEFYDDTAEFTPEWYLWDARRFCHKVYAMLDAFQSEHRYVVWLDVDIELKKDISKSFIKKQLKSSLAAYFGRQGCYTETGFLVFDTEHEDFPEFEKRFRSFYDDKKIFEQDIYVDCRAFDLSIEGLVANNLTPEAYGMVDVFSDSPLAEYMDHDKGQGNDQYRRAG